MEKREVIINYNGYSLPFNLPNNLNDFKESIMEKLYLSNDDMKKYSLCYEDEDNDKINVSDEEDYINAYDSGSQIWGFEIIRNKSKEISKSDSEAQVNIISLKEINFNIKKTQEKIKNIYLEICNEKIKKSNQNIIRQMNEKIKNIENENKEKNSALINGIINDIVNLTKQKFNEVIENYNKAIIKLVGQELNKFEIKMKEIMNKDIDTANNLEKLQVDIKKTFDNYKENFRYFFTTYLKNAY